MYNNKKTAVVIAAAGKGTRIGASVPKQYLKIGGEPILVKTLKAFSTLDAIDNIFIVTNKEYVDHCDKIVRENMIDKVKKIVEGGKERQDSVYNALQAIDKECPDTEYVLVHDGARPYVTHDLILDVIKSVADKGAAVACVPMKDSLRRFDGEVSHSVNRAEYFAVQTPQGFRKSYILKAYEKAFNEGFTEQMMLFLQKEPAMKLKS